MMILRVPNAQRNDAQEYEWRWREYMNYNISTSYFRGFHYLGNVSNSRAKSMEKLSSGYRINNASDDAAHSSMSSVMRAHIRGLGQALKNSDSGVDLLDSAESGLAEITSLLQRIRELGVEAANGTYMLDDRLQMQEEADQLLAEIERVAKSTEYNKLKLLNDSPESGDPARGLAFLVGAGNITPDGFLSETYLTWQMLDPATGGANATQDIYRTLIEQRYTPTSCENVTGYYYFRLPNGTYYTGDIYDSSGNKLGNVANPRDRAVLDPAASTILPENSSPASLRNPSSSSKTDTQYTPPSSTTTTYERDIINTGSTSNVPSNASAVYGRDASGRLVQPSYTSYTAVREHGDLYTEYKNNDEPLAAVSINFEKYNAPGGFTNADLYGTGFNSTCATCNKHYSIKFVEGTTTQLKTYGQHYTLELGIDVLPPGATAADLTQFIVDSIKANATFSGHYTQYAALGSTLYAFDNRSSTVNSPFRMDTYAAISYEDTLLKSDIHSNMKIQTGANAYDYINIALPYISIDQLGIKDIDLRDEDAAQTAIQAVDDALDRISLERTKLGTFRTRLEHVSSANEIGVQTDTDSESKMHDTDMSDEILNLTKLQVLEEFGVNSVAEINKMILNVSEFIK